MDRENWQEWLTVFGGAKMSATGSLPLLLMMVVSLLASLFIMFLYVKFYRVRATGSMVHMAFPVLGPSITAIFICIQFSLPLSLGLLGALSIVRFRAPIKEPEEIGFIMLVVASALCCATFNVLFLSIILGTAVVSLLLLRWLVAFAGGRLNGGMLMITLPKSDYRESAVELFRFLESKIPDGRVESVVEDGDHSILSYGFLRLSKDVMIELQEIELISSEARHEIFFNRSGEV